MIETCFEMLKSSEHEKSWRYAIYKSKKIKDVLKLDQLIPQFHFIFKFLE